MNSNNCREFVDYIYGKCFTKEGNTIMVEVDTLCEGKKIFTFYKAKITNWEISVWESNPFNAYPKRFAITSKSGLTMKVTTAGCTITNPNRLGLCRNALDAEYYVVEKLISFC